MNTSIPRWPAQNAETFVDELFAWYEDAGTSCYDEELSQLEHGLQSAFLAGRAGDSDHAITAALLHDIGHMLLADHDAQNAVLETDLAHEIIGANWLSQMFPTSVTQPVREHVRVKRYLCTIDSAYYEQLSAGSKHSFKLQGGALSQEELEVIEALPLGAAIALRRRDDAAKVPGREVPQLNTYYDMVKSIVQTGP